MATLGNTTGSSLMRSASATQKTIADIQDKQADNEWKFSAKTDADWEVYNNYLTSKMDKLVASPTLANISRLESLRSQQMTASRLYSTNRLSRISNDIVTGAANSTDKFNMIVDLYNQANAEGNYDFAQSLVSQANSLSQKMQYDQDVAARAYEADRAATIVANKEGYESAIDMIESWADSFGTGVEGAGQSAVTKKLQEKSKVIVETLKSMGIEMPEGAQLNNGSIIQGLFDAKAKIYSDLADMYAAEPNGQAKSDNYKQKFTDIIQGNSAMSIGGESFTYQEAQAYAQDPNMYKIVATKDQDVYGKLVSKFTAMPIVDYQYDEAGNLRPIYGDTTTGKVGETKGVYNLELTDTAESKQGQTNREQIQKELEGLGFTDINIDAQTGDITAKSSDDPTNAVFNDALKKLGINTDENTGRVGQSEIRLIRKGGGYQISPLTTNSGDLKSLYLSLDERGKAGIYETKYDFATKQPLYTLVTKSDPNYNTVRNATTEMGFGQNSAWAIANAKPEQLQANTMAGAKFRKELADKYYGGDQNAAWEDVSKISNAKASTVVREQVKQQLVTPQQYPTLNANATPIVSTSKVNTSLTPNFISNKPTGTINEMMPTVSKMFSGYGTVLKEGYTESNIIPEIATKFFSGDKQKASDVVYKYRKETFGN